MLRRSLRSAGALPRPAKDTCKDRAYRSVGCENRRIGWWDFNHAWEEFAADLRAAIDRAPRTDEDRAQR
ncbi:MAG: hypothetical protein ACI867_001931 [Glaciecola sp.]